MIRSIKTFLKGYIGEFKANALNKMMLDNDDFYVINNLTIPKYHNSDDDHLTTQVDGVLISKSTNQVIVLEVKNYNGLIIGDVNDRNWVAKYGDNVFEKYNPLFQNYGHIKSIQNLIKEKLDIDIPIANFSSLIYYNGNATLQITDRQNKNEKINGDIFEMDCIVNNTKDYFNFIQIEIKKAEKRIDIKNDLSSKINDLLNDENMTNGFGLKSFLNSRKHIKNVKKMS